MNRKPTTSGGVALMGVTLTFATMPVPTAAQPATDRPPAAADHRHAGDGPQPGGTQPSSSSGGDAPAAPPPTPNSTAPAAPAESAPPPPPVASTPPAQATAPAATARASATQAGPVPTDSAPAPETPTGLTPATPALGAPVAPAAPPGSGSPPPDPRLASPREPSGAPSAQPAPLRLPPAGSDPGTRNERRAAEAVGDNATGPGPAAKGGAPGYQLLPVVVPPSGAIRDLIPSPPSWARGNLPLGLAVLLAGLLLTWVLRRFRHALPRDGWMPWLVRTLILVARLATAAAALVLIAKLLSPFAIDAYPWLLAAAALAVGWSLRDVLPDMVAAVVLRLENRLKPGVWVASAHYEGVVEGRSLRALWLRDPRGDRLAIPNRSVLGTALRIQEGMGAIHDVALRLPPGELAQHTREAILEAVVTSPYVAATAEPAIRRDGADPDLWRVRARLLHERYAIHFEGELLERVEAAMRQRDLPAASNLSSE